MSVWSRRGTVLLAVCALVTACSLFGEDRPAGDSDAPVPVPEQAFEPTQPPRDADRPGTVYQVRWEASEPPESAPFNEMDSPFAEFLDEDPAWHVYLIEGAGQPRLVYQSTRMLANPTWTADGGLLIPFATRGTDPSRPGEVTYAYGLVDVDGASGRIRRELLNTNPEHQYWSPDGELTTIVDRTGPLGFPVQRGKLFIVDSNDEARRLEGFAVEAFAGWSPDGRYIVASGHAGAVLYPQELSTAYYLIEPGHDQIVLVGYSRNGQVLGHAWSPDGRFIAFPAGSDVVILDVISRARKVVVLSVEIPSVTGWSHDGRLVTAGDGLIDAATGRVLLAPTVESVISADVSLDGKRLVVSRQPAYAGGPCAGSGSISDNQTLIRSVDFDSVSVALECEAGFHSHARWLVDGRLALKSPICWACDGADFWIKLFDPDSDSGDLLDLTDGFENRGDFAISPDGSRVLVSGNALRLYDAEGRLLRRVDVAAGLRVTGIAWSSDGSSFAYVVGPRLDLL
jgi:WD40 repeat protein